MSVDLESRSACDALSYMRFLPVSEHDLPIAGFEVPKALGCALSIKRYTSEVDRSLASLLRIEHQEFDAITAAATGHLYLLEGAVRCSRDRNQIISVLALRIVGDSKLRWFWTVKSPVGLLQALEREAFIGECKLAQPGTTEHRKLYMTLSTLFERLIAIPEAPAFKQSELITDYAPDIDDPDTAWNRVFADEYIYYNAKDPMRDMSDDRYLLHLHDAERYIASYSNISAASYLLLKRKYFQEFFRDLTINRERINGGGSRGIQAERADDNNQDDAVSMRESTEPQSQTASRAETPAIQRIRGERQQSATPSEQTGTPDNTRLSGLEDSVASRTRGSTEERTVKTEEADTASETPRRKRKYVRRRVRTENAHIEQIRREQGWSLKRAKLFIQGWTVLGFLDETKFIDWIDAGGMFETIGLREED